MSPRDQSRLPGWLDGAEMIVSTIYLALLGVVGIAAIGAVTYLLLNPPASFGTQGEWFYVGVGFILVMLWVASQTVSVIRRIRREPSQSREIAGPQVTTTPSGLSISWGTPPAENRGAGRWSWKFQAGPPLTRTFAIDAAQLAAARAARDSGRSWKEIALQLNPEYASLNAIEQTLYEHALQLAVDQPAERSQAAGFSPPRSPQA